MIFRTDDCLVKILRIQADLNPVWCGYYNHTTDPVGGYGDFLHDVWCGYYNHTTDPVGGYGDFPHDYFLL